MEERYIALSSSDLRVGDRADIQVSDAALTLWEKCSIPLTIVSGRPIRNLTIKEASGFSALSLEFAETEEGCSGVLNIVPEGDPGHAALTLTVLTGDVGATAGITMIKASIKESSIGIEIPDAPLHWDGTSPLIIPLLLSSRSRSKGRIEAAFPDTGKTFFTTSVSFKGDHKVSARLDPSRAPDRDRMDVLVRFIAEGKKEETIFKGAIVVDRSEEEAPSLPGIHAAGSDIELGSILPKPVEAYLTYDGQRTILDIVDEGNGPLIRIPDDASGACTLELKGPSGPIISRDISVQAISPIRSLSVKPEQDSVMSGDVLKVRIDHEMTDISALELRINIGRDRRMTLSAPLQAPAGSMVLDLKIPSDHPSGIQPSVIEVHQGENIVLRQVRAGFVTIMSSLSLPVMLVLPSSETNPYLFPGESVKVEESLGSIRCLELTTGRRLLMLEGNVLWGHGWIEDDTPHVIDLYLTMLYRDALSDMDRFKSIRQGISRQMGVTVDVISERPAPAGDLPAVSRSSKAYLSGSDGGEIGKGIDAFVGSLLSGQMILDGYDAAAAARVIVEGAVRALKGVDGSSTTHTIIALKDVLADLDTTLRTLRSGGDQPKKMIERTLRLLIFSSLLQVELASVWTDPAISAWDDLRTMRQRYIKRSIQNTLVILEAISSIHTRASGRIATLRTNMSVRRALAAIREAKLKGSPMLRATGTGSMKGELEIIPGPGKLESDLYIIVPSSSWQLVSPLHTRDRTGMFIGRFDLDPKRPIKLEIELIPPQGSIKGSPVIFMRPSRSYLEAEL